MTKSELIDALHSVVRPEDRLSKAVFAETLDALAQIALDQVRMGGEVTLPGLGKLVLKESAERTGRNPKTGESMVIPAKRSVGFRPAASAKKALA